MKEAVFIDAQFFIEQNFIESNKLKQLNDLRQQGHLSILTTRIVIDEVKSHIRAQLLEAKESTLKLSKKGILKINNISKKLQEIDFDKEIVLVSKKFEETFLIDKVEVLEYQVMEIKSIFDKYFNSENPFGLGKNKAEFPDAFSLAILEDWCQKNNRKCQVISKDKGVQGYKSHWLTSVDINSFLDAKIKEVEKEKAIQIIDEVYQKEKERIHSILEDKIIYKIEDDLINDNALAYEFGYEIQSVENIELRTIQFTDYSIISFREIDADIEIQLYFKFRATINFKNYNHAHFNSQDGVWIGVFPDSREIISSNDVPVTLTVDHTPITGKAQASIQIKEIGNLKFYSNLIESSEP